MELSAKRAREEGKEVTMTVEIENRKCRIDGIMPHS